MFNTYYILKNKHGETFTKEGAFRNLTHCAPLDVQFMRLYGTENEASVTQKIINKNTDFDVCIYKLSINIEIEKI